MNCTDVKKSLPDYLEGDLSLEARARVDTHLDDCEACIVEVAELEQTILLLRSMPAPETPPPPPDLAPPEPAYIPPPEIKLETPPPPAPKAIQAVQETKPEPQPVQRRPQPAVTGPRADPSHGNTQPPYPAASRRMGEEGRVVLELYVDASGDVTKGRIAQSSGFPRLDKTALIHAKRKWHFLPALQNGKPVGHWLKFAVAFKLTD